MVTFPQIPQIIFVISTFKLGSNESQFLIQSSSFCSIGLCILIKTNKTKQNKNPHKKTDA